MEQDRSLLTTNRKALTINLDAAKYGTFAEIGAGQEVARYFFQAGGAAGTVAKTMSAYDMRFSDAIYGRCARYVSQERLTAMLEHEYALLLERLAAARGAETTFFVFADTVAARSFKGSNEQHGWMGLRFQLEPGRPPNDIVIHVRMWDKENVQQQQALGVVGVNLIYGAFYYHQDLHQLIDSLVDQVGAARVEVDMITVSGPDFLGVDNRLLSLRLVERGLTNAVLFGPDGGVLQPSEVLRHKAVLVERGTFRPPTRLNEDLLRCACARFAQEPAVEGREFEILAEMTVAGLAAGGAVDPADFLARADALGALGHKVLVSNYTEYHRLVAYFRRYTKERIGVALGVNHLLEIFNERYYESLEGGILEAVGRLFRHGVRLYAYPMRAEDWARSAPPAAAAAAPSSGALITARNLCVPPPLSHLYDHLRENCFVESLEGYDERALGIRGQAVLDLIRAGDPAWESLVPGPVVTLVRSRGLFGYTSGPHS